MTSIINDWLTDVSINPTNWSSPRTAKETAGDTQLYSPFTIIASPNPKMSGSQLFPLSSILSL
ncbi:hypothetical protein BVRB_7g180050 [Beta vulgaris subsp. vulgaris]|uniref:Uncharacterized protein n=1 Tax=Beta vulgaris subsp. vulgaris TaxID=3555 RepID=A0A0J8BAJ5_BETVV|nr:hypothetical protein BVRB_7g180050 [Beta vulgaris subsp. vulgaris]